MPNLEYSREYSQFPSQPIHMRTFKDPDNTKAAIIEQIEQLKKNGNYTGAAELLRSNPDLIDYAVQSDDINTLIEEILNAQMFALKEKQNLFYTPMSCDYITKTRPLIFSYINNSGSEMPYNYVYITSTTETPVYYAPYKNDNPITPDLHRGFAFFSNKTFDLRQVEYHVGQHLGGSLYGKTHRRTIFEKYNLTIYTDSIPNSVGQGVLGGYSYGIYNHSRGRIILNVDGITFNRINTSNVTSSQYPTAQAVNSLLIKPLLTTLPRFTADVEDVWISNEIIDYEVRR